MTNTSFLEAFNAKHLSNAELVKSFVTSESFNQCTVLGHSILIGPRGSGKTTLLRMLSLDAEAVWSRESTSGIRLSLDFKGIYVRSDMVWGKMLESLSKFGISAAIANQISTSAFSTHVFKSVITTLNAQFMFEMCRDNTDKQQVEKNIGKCIDNIYALLKLPQEGKSFDSIINKLTYRLIEIKSKVIEFSLSGINDYKTIKSEMEYLDLPLLTIVEEMLKSFDIAVGCESRKWALLLDEFEIAPPNVQADVMDDLRSGNEKFFYKIAIAPCGSHLNNVPDISKSNDYNIVELWSKEQTGEIDFSKRLFEHKYKRQPSEVFGNTKYHSKQSEEESWHDKWGKYFLSLSEKDREFKKFLNKKGYEAEGVVSGEYETNAFLRKIAPIVAFKDALIKDDGVRKSRKNIEEFYSGWEAIAIISEGNPRWLIAMLNTLNSKVSIETGRIPSADQSRILTSSSKAYAAMLKTTSTSMNMGITTKKRPYDVVKMIADYFINRLLKEPFKEDFPLSFTVDEKVDEDTKEALRIALNYGAIVALSQSGDITDYQNLDNKRYRISFMLSPDLNMPLRSSKSISLSGIIKQPKENISRSVRLKQVFGEELVQGSLFDESKLQNK